MAAYAYSIDVVSCKETGVFVGTSNDIPGLTLEADTLGKLFDAAMEVVPQLLENNLGIPADADVDVTVRVAVPPVAFVGASSRRQPREPVAHARPRYVYEELAPAYSY